MGLQKYNEFFKWLKGDKPSDYKDSFEYLKVNYKTMEFEPRIDFSRENHVYVSFFKDESLFSYMMDLKNGKYIITDCQKDVEYSDEEKKRTKMNSYYLEIEITKSEYDNYYREFKNIFNYLDDKSDRSKSSINTDGLNLDVSEYDIAKMGLDENISKMFSAFLNKDYEFEIAYYLWKNNSENKRIIEDTKVKVTELRIRPYLNMDEGVDTKKSKFYIEIATVWEDKDYYIHFTDDSDTQPIDLSKRQRKMPLILTRDTSHLTRRQKREEDSLFPRKDILELSPNKYSTIEFLTELKNTLESINEKYS